MFIYRAIVLYNNVFVTDNMKLLLVYLRRNGVNKYKI